MKIKEDIRFRTSEDGDAYAFMIKSKSVFEFRGRHDVRDADDQVIGQLEKAVRVSLFRSHWKVKDADGQELFEAHESSWVVALVRRIADIGIDWLSLLSWLPFNFTLRRNGGRDVQARAREVPRPLRARGFGEGLIDADRRLVVAFAVALDALQDR